MRRGEKRLEYLRAIFFSALFSFAYQGVVMSQSIAEEVKEIRKRDKKAEVDITTLALRFIPIGTAKDEAIRILGKEGFKVYVVDEKIRGSNSDEEVVGTRVADKKWSFFKDEIRIALRFKNKSVSSVTGRIFFHAF